jgi:hypothetical protein
MLAKTNVIDLIAQDARECLLGLVVEEGEWDNPDRLWLLQEKVNTYAAYALDGALHAQYPGTAGKEVVIQIQTEDPLPPDAKDLVHQLAEIMRREKVSLSVQPLQQAAA